MLKLNMGRIVSQIKMQGIIEYSGNFEQSRVLKEDMLEGTTSSKEFFG